MATTYTPLKPPYPATIVTDKGPVLEPELEWSPSHRRVRCPGSKNSHLAGDKHEACLEWLAREDLKLEWAFYPRSLIDYMVHEPEDPPFTTDHRGTTLFKKFGWMLSNDDNSMQVAISTIGTTRYSYTHSRNIPSVELRVELVNPSRHGFHLVLNEDSSTGNRVHQGWVIADDLDRLIPSLPPEVRAGLRGELNEVATATMAKGLAALVRWLDESETIELHWEANDTKSRKFTLTVDESNATRDDYEQLAELADAASVVDVLSDLVTGARKALAAYGYVMEPGPILHGLQEEPPRAVVRVAGVSDSNTRSRAHTILLDLISGQFSVSCPVRDTEAMANEYDVARLKAEILGEEHIFDQFAHNYSVQQLIEANDL